MQAWFLLLAFDVALRAFPPGRVARLGGAVASGAGDVRPGLAWPTIQRLWRLVEVAAGHHLYPMRCLQRSLVLQRLLACRGIYAKLQIGVCRDADQVSAHAWLEYGGRPVAQPETVGQRFAPLVTVVSWE